MSNHSFLQHSCAAILSVFCVLGSGTACVSAQDYRVVQKPSGFVYDTATGIGSRSGIERRGLLSASRLAGQAFEMFWEPGAFRPTVRLDGRGLVDGYDRSDVSRLGSFRLGRDGSFVYLRSTKGRSAVVELVQDGQVRLSWPRLSIVKILSYRKDAVVVSVFDRAAGATRFWRYRRLSKGRIDAGSAELIGTLSGCALQGASAVNGGFALQVFCGPETGSDVHFLNETSRRIFPVAATPADEYPAPWLERGQPRKNRNTIAGVVPVLSVSGNGNARRFFHAISGIIMRDLGEPMSLASDEAGKLSWGQSYRLRTLAELHAKTGHPIFARLANSAMSRMLENSNVKLAISGELNPGCGWASRIYSEDKKTPVSFLINQAMIVGSMLKTCERLDGDCNGVLRRALAGTAMCLVDAYEQDFDPVAGLYRIPREAPFRYAGRAAPWNWQMAWLPVLSATGQRERAKALYDAFTATWTFGPSGALWRYWPGTALNAGRKQPKKTGKKQRYEDVNHAGISLLGLSSVAVKLPEHLRHAASIRLDNIINSGFPFARDMDGRGPKSSRWIPGAGWHLVGARGFERFYDRLLPGSVSSDQHLAYALLADPGRSFDLSLSHLRCSRLECGTVSTRNWNSIGGFLSENPLFEIRTTGTGH